MINYTPLAPSSERLSNEFLAVNSCGIEKLAEIDRGSLRKKGRIDYHILYVEQGMCYALLDGEEKSIGPGNILLFRPGEPQCYHFRAVDQSVSHYIHFTGAGCEELLRRLGIEELCVFDMGRSGTYEEISAKMAREYTLKRRYWESYAVGYLYELLSLIARKHSYRRDSISHETEQRISTACRRICDNPADPPSLSTLAADCHLSLSRFSHLFSEVVGKPPKEFILSLRIERATELLETTALSVKEIAEQTGFSDQNYFSRVFKRRLGCSPTSYQKRLS